MTTADPAVRALAAELTRLRRQLRHLSQPQLAHSSIEDGALNEYDASGQLVQTIGRQYDGTHGAVTVAGPTPPTPAGVTAEEVLGGVRVKWDGSWVQTEADAASGRPTVAPQDFRRAEIEVSTSPAFDDALAGTPSGAISSARGGEWIHVDTAGTALYARLRARTTAGKVGQPSAVAGPVTARPVESPDIAVNAITADHLAALIVLASTIVAGDPAGEHTQLDASGLAAYADDPVDGIPNEIARFGGYTSGRDPATGEITWSINEQGFAGLAGLAVADPDPSFGGLSLDDRDWSRPWGVVGYGVVPAINDWAPSTSTEIGILEIAFTLKAGRAYRLHTNGIQLSATAGDVGFIGFRQTQDGSTPSVSSPLFLQHMFAPLRADWAGMREINFFTQGSSTPGNDLPVRILMTYGAFNGSTVRFSRFTQTQLWVEDIGPRPENIGVLSTGGGSETASVTTKTTTWAASWSRSWKENLTTVSHENELYQGYSQGYDSHGIQKSACGFPDMTSELSGASIGKVELYLYAEHWWYKAGGTARIGWHGSLNLPASHPGHNNVFDIKFARNEGKWLDITSWAKTHGIQSGALRGIALGYHTTSAEYYGRVSGHLDSTKPLMRVTYTK
jgi:hypothetical protein